MDASGPAARRRLRIRHVLETGRTGEFYRWRFIAVMDAKPNRLPSRFTFFLEAFHSGGFMRIRSIVLTMSISSLVAIGCDSSTSPSPDSGPSDATMDGPSSDAGGVDAPQDSAGDAPVDGGEAGEAATQGGDASGDGGDASDALGMADGSDALSLVDGGGGDALGSVDGGDALSLPDAGDALSLADSGD
jgi:hypothetical protein